MFIWLSITILLLLIHPRSTMCDLSSITKRFSSLYCSNSIQLAIKSQAIEKDGLDIKLNSLETNIVFTIKTNEVLSGIIRRSQQDPGSCLKTTGQIWESRYSGFRLTRTHHENLKTGLINSY